MNRYIPRVPRRAKSAAPTAKRSRPDDQPPGLFGCRGRCEFDAFAHMFDSPAEIDAYLGQHPGVAAEDARDHAQQIFIEAMHDAGLCRDPLCQLASIKRTRERVAEAWQGALRSFERRPDAADRLGLMLRSYREIEMRVFEAMIRVVRTSVEDPA